MSTPAAPVSSQSTRTRDMAFTALAAVIITVCSYITIPIGAVPFTLQTFAVFSVTAILGTRKSFFAILLYIIMGVLGLPVFSGMKGGIGVLFGTTGGYILGFLIVPLVYGLLTFVFNRKMITELAALALGDFIVFFLGTVWFIAVYTGTKGAVTIGQAAAWCVIPFIVPDLVKLVVAVVLAGRVRKALRL